MMIDYFDLPIKECPFGRLRDNNGTGASCTVRGNRQHAIALAVNLHDEMVELISRKLGDDIEAIELINKARSL